MKKFLVMILCCILCLGMNTFFAEAQTDSQITIDYIRFTDGSNNWFNIPPTPQTYTIQVVASDCTDKTVIIAFYDDNRKLISTYLDKTTLISDDHIELEVEITEDIDSFQIFILDENLKSYLQYPNTYSILLESPYTTSFSDNQITFSGIRQYDDAINHITIPRNIEIFMSGERVISFDEELFTSGYALEFISENKLGEFNKVNIRKMEYGYLQSVTSQLDEQGKETVSLQMETEAGKKTYTCSDMIHLNRDFCESTDLVRYVNEPQLIKFGFDCKGQIDVFATATDNNFYTSYDNLSLYFQAKAYFNRQNMTFGYSSNTVACIDENTRILFVDAGGVNADFKSIDELSGSLYEIRVYDLSGDFQTAEIIVCYNMMTMFPVNSYTPTYLIQSVEPVQNEVGFYKVSAFTIDPNTTDITAKEFIANESLMSGIHQNDVVRMTFDDNGEAYYVQSIYSNGYLRLSEGTNPFGSETVGFGGALGRLCLLSSLRIKIEIINSKIYALNESVACFKQNDLGNIERVTSQQLDYGKNVLIIYYDGVVRAIYQVE